MLRRPVFYYNILYFFFCIFKDFFYSVRRAADQVLSSAGLKKEDVDDIILTGGLARVPGFRKVLKNHFNGKVITFIRYKCIFNS